MVEGELRFLLADCAGNTKIKTKSNVALSVTISAKTIVFFYKASHGAGLWLIATAMI